MSALHHVTLACCAAAALAAWTSPAPAGDADYIAKSMTAAPEGVSKGAAIVAMDKSGAMRTLRKGGDGWTCMLMPDSTPMCADAGGLAWMHALIHHMPPPKSSGFMYMLAGDHGASNVSFTSHAHMVTTGPHVMILGPAAKAMGGFPRALDPDPRKPYVMWPGTPFEHLMLPVK